MVHALIFQTHERAGGPHYCPSAHKIRNYSSNCSRVFHEKYQKLKPKNMPSPIDSAILTFESNDGGSVLKNKEKTGPSHPPANAATARLLNSVALNFTRSFSISFDMTIPPLRCASARVDRRQTEMQFNPTQASFEIADECAVTDNGGVIVNHRASEADNQLA